MCKSVTEYKAAWQPAMCYIEHSWHKGWDGNGQHFMARTMYFHRKTPTKSEQLLDDVPKSAYLVWFNKVFLWHTSQSFTCERDLLPWKSQSDSQGFCLATVSTLWLFSTDLKRLQGENSKYTVKHTRTQLLSTWAALSFSRHTQSILYKNITYQTAHQEWWFRRWTHWYARPCVFSFQSDHKLTMRCFLGHFFLRVSTRGLQLSAPTVHAVHAT